MGLADDDHDHAAERRDRPEDRASADLFAKNAAASRRAISGAMKVKAIACASGTRPMPQKNSPAISVTMTLRIRWMRRVDRSAILAATAGTVRPRSGNSPPLATR